MIHRLQALLLALLAVAVAAASGCVKRGPVREMVPTRRHVLLLTIDTLRADYLSANGYDLPTTPFFDQLVAGGFHFERAITPIPRTTQALASLLTGKYPRTTTVRNLFDRLPSHIPSLAELARRRGYATVAVVSNHILTPERGLARGFDVYDHADDSRDATSTTDAALQRMRNFQRDDPVFLWVHYIDPHVPYYPPPRIAQDFDPGYEGPYRMHFGAIRGGTGDSAYPAELGKAGAVFRNSLGPAVNAHVRRLYAADIRYTDDEVARLIHGLRESLGEWLIVFTADHGESLGENNYYFDHGEHVSNAELRVPLAFVLPEGDPLHDSRRISRWVSLTDVAPTLIELLDLGDLPEGVEGRSLLPYIRGEDPPERAVFAECGESYFPELASHRVRFDVPGRLRTVFFGGLKLVWTPGKEEAQAYRLFDLELDPKETADLYPAAPHRAAPLKQLLLAWGDSGPAPTGTMSDGDRERLRALGYVE